MAVHCPPACNCPPGAHSLPTRSSCGTCAHAEAKVVIDGPVFECRRFPPVFIVVDDEPRRLFPQVDAGDWCGEHLPTAAAAPIPHARPD